jgi:outer membrane protein assembly factor BamB
MTRRFLFALFVPVALAALAAGADWPCFRGAKRDNHSPDKGLLKEWPKDGPKLAWKATGVGQGFSSVAVAGDRVYTMGNKGGDAYLFAIDRKKGGEPLWEAKIGADDNRNYPGTRCTPTVDGDRVYGLSAAGDLVCVEAPTGKELWRKSFNKDYKGSAGGWKYSESPLIDGDRLVCTPGGGTAPLLVLDKKTGEEVWKAQLKPKARGISAGYSSVVISKACGVKQYVTLTSAGTVGFDAATGKELWRYEKLGNNTANIPTPVVLGDQIFTTAGYGKGGALLTLSKDGDGVSAKEEYYEGDLRNKHGGVVVVGDYVYGDTDDSGNPYCAEWKTGRTQWKRNQTKVKFRGSGSASLTYADGHLYVHYANGYVSLVPASPKGYKEAGSFKIPNSNANSWAHPVVIDGKLYLREKDAVWCYDVKG